MSAAPPAAEVARVATALGPGLLQRTWRPAAGVPERGSLLLVHGVGEHSGRYDAVVALLTGLGLVVRGWDQRGFGASPGPRGALAHDEALLDDAAELFERFAAERRERGDAAAPFILGHSMGGCVVARLVTDGRIAPRGMVLSSPGLVPRINAVQRAAALAGRRVAPSLAVPHGLPLHRLSHDPEVEPRLRADPLAHDRVTPRLVAFMLEAGEEAIAEAARCRVPTLVLAAGDDSLVRVDGSRRFHANLPPGVGTLHVYPVLWHELFNELAPERAAVFADLEAWLRARLG